MIFVSPTETIHCWEIIQWRWSWWFFRGDKQCGAATVSCESASSCDSTIIWDLTFESFSVIRGHICSVTWAWWALDQRPSAAEPGGVHSHSADGVGAPSFLVQLSEAIWDWDFWFLSPGLMLECSWFFSLSSWMSRTWPAVSSRTWHWSRLGRVWGRRSKI